MDQKDIKIPSWMTSDEQYSPYDDNDGFITKSLLSVLGVLGKIRKSADIPKLIASTHVRLVFMLLTIILISCSHNMFFVLCVMAFWMIRCCILPGTIIQKIVLTPLAAACFSLIILLPSVFLGSYNTALTIAVKVFVSVGLLDTFALTTPWNRITESLRFFHIPDLFIFVLDITLKYIIILGDMCSSMLQALKMRSIGCNRKKGHSLGGVLGVTFLKSKEMSEEMYGAMVCRGFEGEYHRMNHLTFQKWDILYLFAAVLFVVLFVILH